MEEAEKLLHELRTDPNFREFCSASFDPAEFSSAVVAAKGGKLLQPSQPAPGSKDEGKEVLTSPQAAASSQAEVTLQAVGAGLARVKAALKAHVSAHRVELGAGMHPGPKGSGITLSEQCYQTRQSTAELRRCLQRVRSEVFEPYESVRTRVLQLQHLSQAQKVLKRVLRVLFALRKLRQQSPQLGLGESDQGSNAVPSAESADLRELATAAQSVYDLEKLFADPTLTGIELVEEERAFVRRAGERVRRLAGERLERGLRALNQAEVAGALQVFHNLRCLPDRCRAGVSRLVDKATEAVRRGLETEALSALVPSSTPAPGLTAREAEAMAARQVRTRSREHCDSIANKIYAIAMQARLLQQVLVKKQDPTTQEYFIEVLRKEAEKQAAGKGQRRKPQKSRGPTFALGVFVDFWNSLSNALVMICKEALVTMEDQESESALADLYPFLRRAFLQLANRLEHSTEGDRKALQLASLTEIQPSAKDAEDLFGEGACGLLGGGDFVLHDLLEMTSTESAHADIQSPWNTPPEAPPSILGSQRTASTQSSPEGHPKIREALLESVGPLRDRFLAESLAKLTNPVEQMFPEMEGFGSAVPSRHDLAFIVRACHTELQRAAPEIGGGEATLAPALAKGISKAVTLIAHKVEAMAYTDPTSFTITAASLAKEPTSERLHHIQLLNLLSRLRQDIRNLPLPSPLQEPYSQDAADALAPEQVQGILTEVEATFQTALTALDNVALDVLIEPYFAGVSKHLESLLSEVHKEHFGETAGVNPGASECSSYMANFQDSLQTFLKVHAGQFPDATFTRMGVARLCQRLVFSLVSHLALVRPLGEQGRLALARDLAFFEGALGTLTKVAELGTAYTELRAFRQLLFLEESPNQLFNSQSLLQEEFVRQLRPSTVFHHMLSRGPDDLISPQVMKRIPTSEYVNWLVSNKQQELPNAGDTSSNKQQEIVANLEVIISFEKETEAWDILNQSVDAYFQRMTVQQEGQSSDPRLVKLILSLGPAALALYQKNNSQQP